MAQTAKTGADKAADDVKNTADNVADLGKRAADQAADASREAAGRAEEGIRRTAQLVERSAGAASEVQREVAQKSAEGTAELGRVLVDMLNQQTRHNLETFNALTQAVDWDRVAKAVDWDQVVQIQSEFVRVSLDRAAQITQRYLEISQAVVTSAASVAQRQAKKAA